MDFTWNKLCHTLSKSQPRLFRTIIKDCHHLNRPSNILLIKENGATDVAIPQLPKVFIASYICNFDAVSIDGDVCDHFFPGEIHMLFKTSNLINNVAMLARGKMLTKFKHAQQRKLAVKISTAAVPQIKGCYKSIAFHSKGPH